MAVATSSVEITDPSLTRSVLSSVDNAIAMCGLQSRCVGIAAVPARDSGIVTGLIGVHGKVSGFITVNMAERVALKAVGGLLGETWDRLTPQVVDGAGEITNIIAGGVKSLLVGSPWSFAQITVPSVILGRGYQIAYAKGLEFLCATFEIEDETALMLEDRLLNVSVSLLRL